MPRRTKEDALKTRQLLIESAIQQFALRGVTGTTLADIADAAGVTRGAVYWHFSSKAELFNEMWQQQLPLRDLLKHEFTSSHAQDPLSRLREKFIIGLQYIAINPRQRALMQILYQKCEFSSEMISEAEIRKKIGLHSAFVGIIKNWLVEPGKFDLYHQAPALVDNIMSVLCGTRGLQAIVNH